MPSGCGGVCTTDTSHTVCLYCQSCRTAQGIPQTLMLEYLAKLCPDLLREEAVSGLPRAHMHKSVELFLWSDLSPARNTGC